MCGTGFLKTKEREKKGGYIGLTLREKWLYQSFSVRIQNKCVIDIDWFTV